MSETTFRAFESFANPDRTPRSWMASLAASSGVYVALAVLVALLGGRQVAKVAEKVIDVTFVERILKEETPPPPPPAAPPEAAPAAAPVVPKNMKVIKLDKPPPAKELLAPKEMPKQAPAEADPSQDKGIAVYGDVGKGDPAGLEGGMEGGVAGGKVGAVALPEDASPPLPDEANTKPSYPQEARANGKQGTVILKVVILADGSVADVQVMRGEEPFVAAALAAVKKWKYTPAVYKGQPITVYRIIQIPFKLTA